MEIDDILRDTLISIANEQLKWDATKEAAQQTKRPIVDILSNVAKDKFSKY